MSDARLDLLVARDDLRSVRWDEVPGGELGEDQARLRVDRFAVTANNLTYAVFGEAMRYWDFFPAPDGFGRIPVWGFATVVESRVAGVVTGERYYGYLPMSTEVVVTVDRPGSSGFVESSPWRVDLPAIYNRYQRASEPAGGADLAADATVAVFRPLFATSYLIDDLLGEESVFGASAVVVSSASSKTALALGHLLGAAGRPGVRSIGLTSPGHEDFVRETGCFDEVVTYDAVPALDVDPAVFVDLAGSATVRSAVHERYGDRLAYSCAVGVTHWEDPAQPGRLPGPRPVFFFAPDRLARRQADWGPGGLESRMAPLWDGFVARAADWLEPSEHLGPAAVEALYRSVLEGEVVPRSAPMASLHGGG